MNELCDYICQWEKRKINWDRSLINNGHLLVDKELNLSDKQIMKQIKKIYDEYDVDLRKALDEDKELDALSDKYKNKLKMIMLDETLLANYCIKTAYRSMSSDKSLCWMLFGEEMIKNLRTNSDERKELIIEQTNRLDTDGNEFLGKYYKLTKLGE